MTSDQLVELKRMAREKLDDNPKLVSEWGRFV